MLQWEQWLVQPAGLLEGQVPEGAGYSKAAAGAAPPWLHYHPPAVAEVNAAPNLADALSLCWQVGLVVLGQPHSSPCSAQHCPAVPTVRCV